MTLSTASTKAGNSALLESLERKIRSLALDMTNIVRAACGQDIIDPTERAIGLWDVYDFLWENKVFNGQMDSVLDIYMEDGGGTPFAVFAGGGKLYSATLNVSGSDIQIGELKEVVQQFVEAPQRSRTVIIRQADGKVRWLALASTSTLNRDGQIDAMELYDSMIRHSESTGEYPYLTFWHEKLATNLGQADFTWREGYCYFITGLFNPDCPGIDGIIRNLETDGSYWGISIGFQPTSKPELIDFSGISIPVYKSGVNIELSVLPERAAASHLTNISVTRGTENRMNEQKRDQFLKLVGDENTVKKLADAATDIAREANSTIANNGMITREAEAAAETDKNANKETAPVLPTIELSEQVVAQITETVLGSQVVQNLTARLTHLETESAAVARASDISAVATKLDEVISRLATLEKPVENKVREAVLDVPSVGKFTVGLRPSQTRAAAGVAGKPAIDHTKV